MTQNRFGTLDGLRGVAAFAVVLYHFGTATGNPYLAPAGKLAVDFFFVLSGFVLAHAYGRRIANGQIGPLEFLRLRFLRLWPTALLGALLGLAVALETSSGSAFRATPARDHRGFGPRAHAERPLELPWRCTRSNAPHWSLLLRTRCETTSMRSLRHSSTRGVSRSSSWQPVRVVRCSGQCGARPAVNGCFRRAVYSVLRRRARVQILGATVSDRKPAHIDLVESLVAVFSVSWAVHVPAIELALALRGISGHRMARRIRPTCPRGQTGTRRQQGEMSYPLYAIHYPFVLLLSERPLRGNFAAMTIGAFAVTLLLSLVALSALSRLYDRPIRSLARRALVAP